MATVNLNPNDPKRNRPPRFDPPAKPEPKPESKPGAKADATGEKPPATAPGEELKNRPDAVQKGEQKAADPAANPFRMLQEGKTTLVANAQKPGTDPFRMLETERQKIDGTLAPTTNQIERQLQQNVQGMQEVVTRAKEAANYRDAETIQTFTSSRFKDNEVAIVQRYNVSSQTWDVFLETLRPTERNEQAIKLGSLKRKARLEDFGSKSPFSGIGAAFDRLNADANRVGGGEPLRAGNLWDGIVGFGSDFVFGIPETVAMLPEGLFRNLVGLGRMSAASVEGVFNAVTGRQPQDGFGNLLRREQFAQWVEKNYLGNSVSNVREGVGRALGADPTSVAYQVGAVLTILVGNGGKKGAGAGVPDAPRLPPGRKGGDLARPQSGLDVPGGAGRLAEDPRFRLERGIDPEFAKRVEAGIRNPRVGVEDISAVVEQMTPNFIKSLGQKQPGVLDAIRQRLAEAPGDLRARAALEKLGGTPDARTRPGARENGGRETQRPGGQDERPRTGRQQPEGTRPAPDDATTPPRSFAAERAAAARNLAGFANFATEGGKIVDGLAGLGQIGDATRARLRQAQQDFSALRTDYTTAANNVGRAKTPEAVQDAIGRFNGSERQAAARNRDGSDPVTATYKRVENTIRDVTEGYARKLDEAASDPLLTREARDWAGQSSRMLREQNANPRRLVEAGADGRPSIALDAFRDWTANLTQADGFLAEVGRIRAEASKTPPPPADAPRLPPATPPAGLLPPATTTPPVTQRPVTPPTVTPPVTPPAATTPGAQTTPPVRPQEPPARTDGDIAATTPSTPRVPADGAIGIGGTGRPTPAWPAPNPTLSEAGNAQATKAHRDYLKGARDLAQQELGMLGDTLRTLTGAAAGQTDPVRRGELGTQAQSVRARMDELQDYTRRVDDVLRTPPPAAGTRTPPEADATLGIGRAGRPAPEFLEPNAAMPPELRAKAMELGHKYLLDIRKVTKAEIGSVEREINMTLRGRDTAANPDVRAALDNRLEPLYAKRDALKAYDDEIGTLVRNNDVLVEFYVSGQYGLGDLVPDSVLSGLGRVIPEEALGRVTGLVDDSALVNVSIGADVKTAQTLFSRSGEIASAALKGDFETVGAILGEAFNVWASTGRIGKSPDIASQQLQNRLGEISSEFGGMSGWPARTTTDFLYFYAASLQENPKLFPTFVNAKNGDVFHQLNATPVDLPRGGADHFGGTNPDGKYYRLNAEWVIDGLGQETNVPFLATRFTQWEAGKGARIVIPEGAILPAEFVDTVNNALKHKFRRTTWSQPGERISEGQYIEAIFPNRLDAAVNRMVTGNAGRPQAGLGQSYVDNLVAGEKAAGAFTGRTWTTLELPYLLEDTKRIWSKIPGLEPLGTAAQGILGLVEKFGPALTIVTDSIPRKPVLPNPPGGDFSVTVRAGDGTNLAAMNPKRIVEFHDVGRELPSWTITAETRVMPTMRGERTRTRNGELNSIPLGGDEAADRNMSLLLVNPVNAGKTVPLMVPDAFIRGMEGKALSAAEIEEIASFVGGLPGQTDGAFSQSRANRLANEIRAIAPGVADTGNGRSALFGAVRTLRTATEELGLRVDSIDIDSPAADRLRRQQRQ